jgi:hypothetical protein
VTSFSRRAFAPEFCKSHFIFLVTTGLDPVVHAEARLLEPVESPEYSSPPHGLPDQVRQ